MDDITKLPKWAQNKIGTLEDKIGTLEAQVRHYKSIQDLSESTVSWIDLFTNETHPLPDHAIIRFKTADGRVDVNLRKGFIDVNSDGVSVIIPEAANHFKVKPQR